MGTKFSGLNPKVNPLNQRGATVALMPVSDAEVERARNCLVAWLRYHMTAARIDQQTLAKRLGVSKGLITQWLGGEGTKGLPGFASLLAISRELDAPLDILLRRNPPQS